MKSPLLRLLPVALVAFVAVTSATAALGAGEGSGVSPLVFVQTNQLSGNQIVVYRRSSSGLLSQAATYATGGLGGAAAGAVSDKLASQGSLLFDHQHNLLFAVNAGSSTISVFAVTGDHLSLTQVVSSGGGFPASLGSHGDLLYVLNAGGEGNINGFRIANGMLSPLAGSKRLLRLGNTNPPFFLTSPGQLGFTPDGSKLIVTTKASTNNILVFGINSSGLPSASPVVNPAATPVPFAFTFQPLSGRLVDGEAGTSSLTTYVIHSDGTLSNPKSLSDGQVALCWITRTHGYYYVSNTGSNTISGYSLAPDGTPSLLTPTGVVATTETGTIDSAAATDSFLYVETGVGGTLNEFHVNGDGTLSKLGVITGLPPGLEGIATT